MLLVVLLVASLRRRTAAFASVFALVNFGAGIAGYFYVNGKPGFIESEAEQAEQESTRAFDGVENLLRKANAGPAVRIEGAGSGEAGIGCCSSATIVRR